MAPGLALSQSPPDPPPFAPYGVHRRQHVYQSDWCSLRRDEVILPNGATQEFHVFEIGPAAVTVPVLPSGDLILIGQYRYSHGATQWELPAGGITQGEDPLVGAQRELLEETGYTSQAWTPLPGFYPTGGISVQYAHAFVAKDCTWQQAPDHEAAEQIIVQPFTRRDVEALLDQGRLKDAFTALPLLYYLRSCG